MTHVSKWFNENSILINVNKTKCVFFRCSRNETVYPKDIDLDCDLIKISSTTGVQMST